MYYDHIERSENIDETPTFLLGLYADKTMVYYVCLNLYHALLSIS